MQEEEKNKRKGGEEEEIERFFLSSSSLVTGGRGRSTESAKESSGTDLFKGTVLFTHSALAVLCRVRIHTSIYIYI